MPKNWKAIESEYYMYTVKRQPIVIMRGQGTTVWDDEGKEYLDFTAGWAVNNIGHTHPVITEAIIKQAGTLLQTSNQFYTVPQLELAQVLVDNSCMDKVFFCNSGAEANEGAIKMARKYGKIHTNGAFEIITADNSFHGRTLTTWSATGKPHEGDISQPLPTGFVHVEFDNIDAIKAATTDRTVAIMLEPVQGEGGVNLPGPDYLSKVRQWCDEKGLLMILDEVQTGLGRLGTLFGYQSFNVEPDVMTLAKGLGGGVPIGAFMAKDHAAVFEPKGEHGSTFGGNALTCAVANASTQFIIDNDISTNARDIGEYLKAGLTKLWNSYDFIVDVRGMGLLIAMEFSSEMSAEALVACNKAGLLLNAPRPTAIRLMPPLTVTRNEVDTALERLEAGLVEAAGAAVQ